MTFESRELSIADGRPIRLYEFSRGTQRWLYTNAALDVVNQNRTFSSYKGISDDGIRQTGEASADALTVTAPLTLPLINLYRVYPPSTPVHVTVYDMHLGDGESVVAWVGTIGDVSRRRNHVRLVCRPLSSDQDTAGLRLTWGPNCPHTLFDRNCKVDKELFRVDATLLSVSGNMVSAAAFAGYADHWFSGGFLEWEGESGLAEQRGIERHTRTDLLLLGGSLEFKTGLAVRGYPGCVGTAQVCDTKFNNSDNNGGVPGLPGKSPFDGDPIF